MLRPQAFGQRDEYLDKLPKSKDDDDPGREEELLAIARGSEKLSGRLLRKDVPAAAGFGESARMCCGMPGSVPFQWEEEPGKPKDLEQVGADGTRVCKELEKLFPLAPPPGRSVLLAPGLPRTQSGSSSVAQLPRYLTGKMKILLNGKFRSPQGLDRDDNSADSLDSFSQCEADLINLGKDVDRTTERSETFCWDGNFDFGLKRSSSKKVDAVRAGIKRMSRATTGSHNIQKSPSIEYKFSNDQESSPRSTLEYASGRSSPSSSAFSFSQLSSFSRTASPSTCSSTSQDSYGGASSNVAYPTAAPAILASCLISIANQIRPESHEPATNHELLTVRKYERSDSGPQPSAIKSSNAISQTLPTPQRQVFSDPQKPSHPECQKTARTGPNLPIHYSSCNDWDQISPQGSVSSLSTSRQLHNNSLEPTGCNRSSSVRTSKLLDEQGQAELKQSKSCKGNLCTGNLRHGHVRDEDEIAQHAKIDPGCPNLPDFLRRLAQAEEELRIQRNDSTGGSSCLAIWRRTKFFGLKLGE